MTAPIPIEELAPREERCTRCRGRGSLWFSWSDALETNEICPQCGGTGKEPLREEGITEPHGEL